jgi:hypothetical protein
METKNVIFLSLFLVAATFAIARTGTRNRDKKITFFVSIL